MVDIYISQCDISLMMRWWTNPWLMDTFSCPLFNQRLIELVNSINNKSEPKAVLTKTNQSYSDPTDDFSSNIKP